MCFEYLHVWGSEHVLIHKVEGSMCNKLVQVAMIIFSNLNSYGSYILYIISMTKRSRYPRIALSIFSSMFTAHSHMLGTCYMEGGAWVPNTQRMKFKLELRARRARDFHHPFFQYPNARKPLVTSQNWTPTQREGCHCDQRWQNNRCQTFWNAKSISLLSSCDVI